MHLHALLKLALSASLVALGRASPMRAAIHPTVANLGPGQSWSSSSSSSSAAVAAMAKRDVAASSFSVTGFMTNPGPGDASLNRTDSLKDVCFTLTVNPPVGAWEPAVVAECTIRPGSFADQPCVITSGGGKVNATVKPDQLHGNVAVSTNHLFKTALAERAEGIQNDPSDILVAGSVTVSLDNPQPGSYNITDLLLTWGY